jgi:hypothetical protein
VPAFLKYRSGKSFYQQTSDAFYKFNAVVLRFFKRPTQPPIAFPLLIASGAEKDL